MAGPARSHAPSSESQPRHPAMRVGLRFARPPATLLLLCASVVAFASCSPAAAQDSYYAPYVRIPWTTSRVVGAPEPPPPYTIHRAFPALTFKEPLFIAAEPGTSRLWVVERGGRLLSFGNRQDVAADDVRTILELGHDAYSVCFHPGYAENGYFYVFNSRPREDASDNRVTRYTLAAGAAAEKTTGEQTAATALEIIAWESNGHNGGDLAFGPDGCLYVTAGDGTVGSDPLETGQNLTDLLATMIRIDVDHPDEGRAYSIPADNPFVGVPGARGEIWALGFRNPWRLSFDPPTGDLWLGDIGQDAWEMIYLVRRGGNYGWAVMEGGHPFQPQRQRGPGEAVLPVVEQPHSEARSIVGGIVYRGERFPELRGQYLYGDFETGRIWGLRYADGAVSEHRELASTQRKFLSLTTDAAGEILLPDFVGGELFRLVLAPADEPHPPFPTRLSGTGLFADTAAHLPADGIVPYEVNSPLWSDGALKERFLAIPAFGTIDYAPQAAWGLPEGTVLVKSFSLELTAGEPQSRRRVETRLLTRQQGQWRGYSYAWNDDETDATLVSAAGANREYEIAGAAAASRTLVWHYPSRAECMMCHSRAAGFVLGTNSPQMDRERDYGPSRDNQLRWLSTHGYFSTPAERWEGERFRLPDPHDASLPLEARVRSYLHANCAICHVADGGGNARMELGYTTPLDKANVVGVRPQHDALGIADALLVAPGDPRRSLLYHRMATLATGRMPRLASSVADEKALALIRAWIEQLAAADADSQAAAGN